MNQPWIKGKWNEFKGRAKERWGDLTTDDLSRVEGRRDQLLGALQQRYGRSRANAEREVDDWERSLGLR